VLLVVTPDPPGLNGLAVTVVRDNGVGGVSVGIVDESIRPVVTRTLDGGVPLGGAGIVDADRSVREHDPGEVAPTGVRRGDGVGEDVQHDKSSHGGAPSCRLGDGST